MKKPAHPLFLGLLAYFNGNSKFQIRYAKSWFRDRIGKAVYAKDFFEAGWTKKEYTEAEMAGLLMANAYRDRDGSTRSVVVFTADDQEQLTPFKRILAGEVRFKHIVKYVWTVIANVIAFLFILSTALVFFFWLSSHLSRLH